MGFRSRSFIISHLLLLGRNEKIEDVNELRFIDYGVKIKMTEVNIHSLSVDTPKDLEYVKKEIERIYETN